MFSECGLGPRQPQGHLGGLFNMQTPGAHSRSQGWDGWAWGLDVCASSSSPRPHQMP